MLAKYKVKPMQSWGNLPLNYIDTWRVRKCDLNFSVRRMNKKKISQCLNTDPNVVKLISNSSQSNGGLGKVLGLGLRLESGLEG
jgi:hypothetical protein